MLSYIHKLIDKNQGSISISDFMCAALYHKKYGYYMKFDSKGDFIGDFVTSPEISQLFGEIIAIWIMHTYEKLGKPEKFLLVELGPGRGTLIKDVIRVTQKYDSFFCSMSIHLIEISPVLQNMQKHILKGFDIKWHKDIDDLPEQPAIFIANEFFDALPIDQFIYYNDQWYENRIAKYNNSFQVVQVVLDNFKDLNNLKVAKFNGAVVEICLSGIGILNKIEKKIHRDYGSALIIDYGYIYPTYKSTLQAIRQHNYVSFLNAVGDSDITAHVNFHALRNALKYTNYEILTQREFLYSFGIKERVDILIRNTQQKERIISEFLRLTENMGTLFKVILIEKEALL
ncbi:SAM-dependent methyltransferase [Wolbachia pipientis]|uniref:SAM-dependent methyltransferase n=1 Tax=Wolbachia pipientis TaxID=955 RepID=A0A1E7QKQ4_WOLPI|nr:SAM-dependent methyltransferase [Wolbachia pipientis]OEY86987.1 SAM-dependent methyltransferase [Wolbachia pipientis]